MFGIDDANAGQIDTELFGNRANLAFRTHQNRLDNALFKSVDRTFERFQVARVGDGHGNRLQSFDAVEQMTIAFMLVVNMHFRHVHFLHVRHFFRGGEHFRRATDDLQVFLVGTHAVKNNVLVMIKFLFRGDGGGDGVANRYGACEMQGLVNQNSAGAGKLCAEHG